MRLLVWVDALLLLYDQGLIATNYHCIERSYLQFNSNAENNLFETGFVARSKEEEKKSAPGSRVYVTLESNEITEQVLMGVKDETADIERAKIIEENIKQIINNCETTDEIELGLDLFIVVKLINLKKF